MRQTTIAAAVALLICGAVPWSASYAADCSAYRAELRVARAELERGNRVAAVAALRRAKAALRSCAEQDSSTGDPATHKRSGEAAVG